MTTERAGKNLGERVISNEEYADFCVYLNQASGIVLGDNKHYLITSRLNRLMQELHYESYSELLEDLTRPGCSSIKEQVVNAMTTNETMWFRDIYPFEVFKNELLPTLAKNRGKPLRVWSAACASGQEPYSISMVISEYIANNPGVFASGSEIIATDISTAMLKFCEQAIYDNTAINRGISEERKARFFKPMNNDWLLVQEVKNRVLFKLLNLQQNYATLGKFDVIFCRNVLIYFSSEFKTDILTRMYHALNPGGYLFLGSSETPMRYTDAFTMVRTPKGVVYQKPEA